MVDKIYTIEQAAGILLIKPRTMREWIRQGKVRAFKIGDLVRIHEEDLQEFIDSARRKSERKSVRGDGMYKYKIQNLPDFSSEARSKVMEKR